MAVLNHLKTHPASPVFQVAIVVAGVIALFVAVKIGGIILKLLLGLAVIGFILWFFAK
jgi:hypothetical protein